MKFEGFIGGSYELSSVSVDCQACINMYPEIIDSGRGKEGQTVYLKPTPGLKFKNYDLANDNEVRLTYCDNLGNTPRPSRLDTDAQANRMFVVRGNSLYMTTWAPSLNDYTETNVSAALGRYFDTFSGPVTAVSMKQNNSTYTSYITIFLDGVNAMYFSKDTNDTGTYTNFDSYENVVPSSSVVKTSTQATWIDGYFIFNTVNTSSFYVSLLGSAEINPLDYATAEGDPDSINGIASLDRYLFLFNDRSTELFSNTGNADFPFERNQDGFIETGCMAPFSIAKGDKSLFWLGRDANGQGIIYRANGSSPVRISTHAIEKSIAGYANAPGARAFCYQKDGHFFYQINFDEKSWVYDTTTGLWHERAFTNNGVLTRHRANTLAFYPDTGELWCGDYQNGNVYTLDESQRYDYRVPVVGISSEFAEITRLRRFPHSSSNLKNVFYNSLQIDMQAGVGQDGDFNDTHPVDNGTNPQGSLRWSDDGGTSWSNEMFCDLGKIGARRTRAIFRRLGRSRDRVFEFKVTDLVDVVWIDAQMEVEVGAS